MKISPPPSTHVQDDVKFLGGWRYRAVLWSALTGGAGYLGFVLWSGWTDVSNAVGKVGFLGLTVALSLSLLNYSFRFLRWNIYLHVMDHPVPWRHGLKIYLAGFAFTTTPAKAGEALRGVLLKPWGVPYPQSLAAFLSERLSDLLAVLLLTLLGMTIYPAAQPLIAVGTATVLAAFLTLLNQGLLERLHGAVRGTSHVSVMLRHLFQILLQARRCHAPTILITASTLSLTAWAAEAWAFYLILQWMGLEVPLAYAIFVYAAAMLAGALSFMPGGLGCTEIVMIALLTWKGAGQVEAVTATVLIRLSTLWFAVAIGIVVSFLSPGNPPNLRGAEQT